MKTNITFIMIFTCFCLISAGQKKVTEQNREAHFSTGFQLHKFDDDFGCGINLTSPWFWKDKTSVRFNGDVVFSKMKNWKPYGSTRLGLVGSTGIVREFCRFYGEGGLQVLTLNPDISADKVKLGGYGHFGFEFFLKETNSDSYFIELGSSGIVAKAQKLEGKPMYFNGFCIGVGTRHYF